jgi:NitT/TauT family transport system substrate-binding protein
MRRSYRAGLLAGLLALTMAGAACGGGGSDETTESKGKVAVPEKVEHVDLRLGYFPNVTHAAAVAGIEGGLFQTTLGENITLKPANFNAGPAAVEALFGNAIDATYIGPNPAINAFAKSNGEAIRRPGGQA